MSITKAGNESLNLPLKSSKKAKSHQIINRLKNCCQSNFDSVPFDNAHDAAPFWVSLKHVQHTWTGQNRPTDEFSQCGFSRDWTTWKQHHIFRRDRASHQCVLSCGILSDWTDWKQRYTDRRRRVFHRYGFFYAFSAPRWWQNERHILSR